MAITPAMREGSGMVKFSREFPEQYFDVAIAEQHAVTLAAGMACEGFNPVVAIYSSFLQRAYDQLIHDVAIMNLPVLFAIDRAGVVGADGPTHQGTFDLSFMRCIPNLVIMTPSDENECRQMLFTGHKLNQPAAVRYPRGTGTGVDISNEMSALDIGKAKSVRESKSKKVAILNFGIFLENAKQAAESLDAFVADMRFVKPMDLSLLDDIAAEYELVVTVEDNAIAGGAGSGVNEYFASRGYQHAILNIGLPDQFIKHGTQQEIYQELALDAEGILSKIEAFSKVK
jgi:1-deoxy-D-xylulose-5-phosphate synthase